MDEYERLYETASDKVWVSATLRPDQLRVRDLIVSIKSSGSVLDVGCYNGAFLASLGPQFMKYGVEASLAAAMSAREKGISIVATKFQELGKVDRRFDVVVAIDVIEHVADPKALLDLLAGRLARNGLIVVSSGNIDTAAWRLAGGRYWYCSFPEHISFISRAWGEKVARELGLEICAAAEFSYGGTDPGLLLSGKWQFFRSVAVSSFKMFVISMLPALARRVSPRNACGQPGLFEDHLVLAFQKSA